MAKHKVAAGQIEETKKATGALPPVEKGRTRYLVTNAILAADQRHVISVVGYRESGRKVSAPTRIGRNLLVDIADNAGAVLHRLLTNKCIVRYDEKRHAHLAEIPAPIPVAPPPPAPVEDAEDDTLGDTSQATKIGDDVEDEFEDAEPHEQANQVGGDSYTS